MSMIWKLERSYRFSHPCSSWTFLLFSSYTRPHSVYLGQKRTVWILFVLIWDNPIFSLSPRITPIHQFQLHSTISAPQWTNNPKMMAAQKAKKYHSSATLAWDIVQRANMWPFYRTTFVCTSSSSTFDVHIRPNRALLIQPRQPRGLSQAIVLCSPGQFTSQHVGPSSSVRIVVALACTIRCVPG